MLKIKGNSVDKIINNTTNNNSNNTINNNLTCNIKIQAYGNEDLHEIISEKMIQYLFKKCRMSIQYLTKYVHFNKNKPQFHNIYIPYMIYVFLNFPWNTL